MEDLRERAREAENYFVALQEDDFIIEANISADVIANHACRFICFGDCVNGMMIKIVLNGRECRYDGWEPNMHYVLRAVDNGEVLWDVYYPEWDH